MSSEHAALAARIRETLLEIEHVVDRAEGLAAKAQRTGDDGFWDGVALNLHGFYAGVERIFEDIARTLEGSVPESGDWHRDLLLQMSADVAGVRPAVLARGTRQCLEEYRGFRHVVRNVYTFSLRPSRLQELVSGLRRCFDSASRDIRHFATFLSKLDDPG